MAAVANFFQVIDNIVLGALSWVIALPQVGWNSIQMLRNNEQINLPNFLNHQSEMKRAYAK